MKRHTCIICQSKRYEQYMDNVFGSSWACSVYNWYGTSKFVTCSQHPDILIVNDILNLANKFTVLSLSSIVRSGLTHAGKDHI